jgi:RimJ/RimL family protein N-acetyltransferase
MTSEVRLRAVEDGDLDALFAHQADPVATDLASFPARNREQFDAHWARIRADRTVVLRAIMVDGVVAGNIVCWRQGGQWLIGYWIGREHWGKGVATRALARLLDEVPARPLRAHVAVSNPGSIRVLEKCGFTRDPAEEATAQAPADGVAEWVYVLAT